VNWRPLDIEHYLGRRRTSRALVGSAFGASNAFDGVSRMKMLAISGHKSDFMQCCLNYQMELQGNSWNANDKQEEAG
jgi:hypothetical protein